MEVAKKDSDKVQTQVLWIPNTPLKPIVDNPVRINAPGDRIQQNSSHACGAPACSEPSATAGSSACGVLACSEPSATPRSGIQQDSHACAVPACSEPSATANINTTMQQHCLRHGAAVTNIVGDSATSRVRLVYDNFPSSSTSFTELLAQAQAPSAHYHKGIDDEILQNQFVPTLSSMFNPNYALLGQSQHDGILKNQFVPTWSSMLNPNYALLGQSQLSCGQSLFNAIYYNYQDLQGTSDFAHYDKTTSQIAPPAPHNAIRAENTQDTWMQLHKREKDLCREEKEVPNAEQNNKEIFQHIDKTPLQKPRRRKHRPKVIKEDKAVRNRKPATRNPVRSKENTTGRRKYVRKKPLISESAEKTCRRSLFETGEQQKDGTSTGRVFDVAATETQTASNEETGAPSTNSDAGISTIGMRAVGSKRKHSGTFQHDNTSSLSPSGQAYDPEFWVQFPNIQKQRRSEKGSSSNVCNTSSMIATKDVQVTCPQEDARSGIPFECNLSSGQRKTKRRSRVPNTKTHVDEERQQTGIDALVAEMHATVTKKQRSKKRSTLVSTANSCTSEMQENHQFVLENQSLPLDNSLDSLTVQFRQLHINTESRELVLHGRTAIVPHKNPRPKVDLDEETNRVWKLLMLDINSHGVDGMDKDKAKWWEEERNVFRGRANSFIARMHSVLGDRRFTKWKGSVVDSVVGVFLTQNVSDHLSSSAFMSLAARFPLKPNSTNKTYHEKSTGLIVNKPQGYIVEPEESTIGIIENSQEKEAVDSNDSCRTSGSLTDESNLKLLESTQRDGVEQHSPMESGAIIPMTGEGQKNSCDGGARKELNDMVSSQCSVTTSQIHADFSVDQSTEKIQSCSESISEVEDLSSAAKYKILHDKISFSKLLEMASSATLHEVSSQRSKPIENLRDVCGQPIGMKQGSLTEKLGVTKNLEANIAPSDEYASKMIPNQHNNTSENRKIKSTPTKSKSRENQKEKRDDFDWDNLRKKAEATAGKREKTQNTMDSLDWDAVRCADVKEIADAIKDRGMNNMLAERIKDFLNRLVDKHEAIDLEWLRDVPPDQVKEYLLSIRGLGLKSAECVRLLTLHHLAFPVDTNVGRIAVRLGWVPLQPLPDSPALHLLELYPSLDSVQKYLWPRLCKLDQRTLYELHYQLITFGKVFCTKINPNCNACPMRPECRHFANVVASARLALPGPEQKSVVITNGKKAADQNPSIIINHLPLLLPSNTNQVQQFQQPQVELSEQLEARSEINICQPIIEEPASPEPECSQLLESDLEDAFCAKQHVMEENMELQESEMSKALVILTPEAASIPTPKLKNISRLRTEHWVYELPDSHCLLEGWDKREVDDPGKYLLAIWTPGETANSIQPPETKCSSGNCGKLYDDKECSSSNSFREANSETVRGTILIPCRTAMRGSFPLNGTYFQVNEVFADDESSLNPIHVARSSIWNLRRRMVYFGTSVSSIFKGLTTPEIQQCFWRGYVCVRGFDRKTRAPRPLKTRLHISASKLSMREPAPARRQEPNPNPE